MVKKVLSRLFLYLVLFLMYLPIFVLIVFSFTATDSIGNWDGFTFQLYGDLFKNKDLMKHFNAPVPLELVRRLLLDGELAELYSTITNLSSYQASSDEEIKN